MASQRTRYISDDGSKVRSDCLTLCIAWGKVTRRVPARFAAGVGYHEPNTPYVTNEQDDDLDDDGNVKHRTGGIFQLDIASASPFQVGDAVAAFGPLIGPTMSVYDIDDACAIFAALTEKRLDWLQSYAGTDDVTDDMLFFLGLGHNQGTGAMKKAVQHVRSDNGQPRGIDAQSYINDNPTIAYVAHGYGRDVMSGGPDYLPSMEPGQADNDPLGDGAPSVTANQKSLLSWALVLVILVAVYWFAYGRRKGLSWLVNL